jgi:hypothetical protein
VCSVAVSTGLQFRFHVQCLLQQCFLCDECPSSNKRTGCSFVGFTNCTSIWSTQQKFLIASACCGDKMPRYRWSSIKQSIFHPLPWKYKGTAALHAICLEQPFSIFLPWRNPWNNFQVSGNPCIKNIICTAHGTLAWSVSCRYINPIIIVNALLIREWYFSVDLFILANKFKKRCLFIFQSRSLAEPLATSRGTLGFTPVEKPWFRD